MKPIVKHSALSVTFVLFLTALLIVLKWVGAITWSWWIVLFPVWLGFVLIVLGSVGVIGFVILISILTAIFNRKKHV